MMSSDRNGAPSFPHCSACLYVSRGQEAVHELHVQLIKKGKPLTVTARV